MGAQETVVRKESRYVVTPSLLHVTHNASAACVVYHWLTFPALLQGPPGNPGYQGQAGSPVSVSS